MIRPRLIITLLLVSLLAGNEARAQWQRASPCSDPLWGWAGLDPVNNIYELAIRDHHPEFRYAFHGEIAWDPNMGSTRGEIRLRRSVENKWQQIETWRNPPGRAKIQVDITKYINGNGRYLVEWKYLSGVSGICIIRSEIVPAR